MKRHALFVGVDNYNDCDIHNLRCAVNDAIDLKSFFEYGAHYDSVAVLANPRNGDTIMKQVQSMVDGLGPGDEFLFFFAGHGVITQDGHRLVCSDDSILSVQHGWHGLPLARLKHDTNGAFNRLFLLDACRTDVLETNRALTDVMKKGTRDLIMAGARKVDHGKGSLTIISSCNDGECAGEVLRKGHGLFSLALLELLKEARDNKCRLSVTDDFVYGDISRRMSILANENRLVCQSQIPQKEGPAFLILDGVDSEPIDASVACPVCGRKNLSENTFKCRGCGRDNLCLMHKHDNSFLCDECYHKSVSNSREKQIHAHVSNDDMYLDYEVIRDYMAILRHCDMGYAIKNLNAFVSHNRKKNTWHIVNVEGLLDFLDKMPSLADLVEQPGMNNGKASRVNLQCWFENRGWLDRDKNAEMKSRYGTFLFSVLDAIYNNISKRNQDC